MADSLRSLGHEVTLLEVTTTGDRWSAEGGPAADKGLFVKELEEALLDGRADLAVHSAKDLPGELPAGLSIIAVPERAAPWDVIVGVEGGLDALPIGASVATGSPRRHAQLLTARPDLTIVDIRGNVDTRLGKLAAGFADALVLAAAGLERLGVLRADATVLDPAVFVPAPGQGCLAIEARTDRADLHEALAPLNDAASRLALDTERAVLAGFGGGCSAPVGAYCLVRDEELVVHAFVSRSGDLPGTTLVAVDGIDDPIGLGEDVAGALRMAINQPVSP